MFEREIKFIYDFNLNRVKKIGSFVSYGQLIQAELHPAILQYISAEIDFLIFEDRQKLLKNSVFDYSGEKISKLFSQIDEEIKLNKKFSVEYVNKLLLHSTSFIINYLMRPRWTMIKFLFNDEEDKSAAEIKQVIKYIYFYGYLKDTLVSYLDKKRIVTIKKNELEDLILKIDLLGMDSYLDAILEDAVRSMAGFFNIGTVQTNKVSLLAVKIFLKEKELTNHIAKLNEVYGEDNKQKVEIDELLLALKGVEYEPSEAFDLKLPTEQIEEDELEQKEIPEFETVEEPEDEFINENEETSNEAPEEKTLFDSAETFPDADESNLPAEENIEESASVNKSLQDEIAEVGENAAPVEDETIVPDETSEIDEDEFEDEEDNLLLREVDERTKEVEPPFEEIFRDDSQTLVVEKNEKDTIDNSVENGGAETVKTEDEFEPLMEEPAQSNDKINQTADEISGVQKEPDDELSEEPQETTGDFEEEETLKINREAPVENATQIDIEEKISIREPQETEDPFVEDADSDELLESAESEAKSTLDDFVELNDEKEEIDLQGFDEIIRESAEKITPPEEYFSERADEEETVEEKTESYAEKIDGETTSSPADVFKEMESDLGLGEQDQKADGKSNGDIVENLSAQPQLFDEADLEVSEMETGFAADDADEIHKPEPKEKTYTKIDISELLHNKNMTKILKVIFDHDMQDFADTIEQISDCGSLEHAEEILETLFKANHIKPTSKEAVAFKAIIQEYFEGNN